MADPRYQNSLDWGEPRHGHPEGTVRAHIAELERNLRHVRPVISKEHYWKLRVLIHTHDMFKSEAKSGTTITDPRSHSSLAREFLSEYCQDEDLLNMVQYHDEGWALWQQYSERGVYNRRRFENLLTTIKDWNLFLWFNLIDACTEGKSREPIIWFIEEVNRRLETSVSANFVF
ncbi:MAG: hypothetical protein WBP85_10555 [Terracidiphilus sp.]